MTVLSIEIMEALDKEWTTFLDGFLWNTTTSIAESNKIFDNKRKRWMRNMAKKYGVTVFQITDRYVHDN